MTLRDDRIESDEVLIERYLEQPRRRRRMAALAVAQSKGMLVDEIERDAVDLIKGFSQLDELIAELTKARDAHEASEAWHRFFEDCFLDKDYRLALEVRRFIAERQRARADDAAR